MPLKDRDRTIQRRITRLGIIRLGYKEERSRSDGSTYEFPVQADHFVLRDAPEVAEFYGVPAEGVTNAAPDSAKLRELQVLLPFPDVERNFDGFYTVWAGGILVCKGDGDRVLYASAFETKRKGEKVTVHRGTAETHVTDGVAQAGFAWNGEEFRVGDIVPCSGQSRNLYPHCTACRRSSLLKVMMADESLFRLGYYQIATGGGANYDSILGTLEIVSGGGRQPVNGIPFVLRMVQRETTYIDDNNVRRKTEKWFLELEPDPTFTRALLQNRAAQAAGLLTAGGDDGTGDVFDGEIIDDGEDAPPPYAEGGDHAEGDALVEAADGLGGEVASANGKAERPLPPVKLRKMLHDKVVKKLDDAPKKWSGDITDGQIKLLNSKLNECFLPDKGKKADAKRHSALGWFWEGRESATELTKVEAGAMLDCLLDQSEEKEGTYDLHPSAPREMQAALKRALKDAGQQEMDLAAE